MDIQILQALSNPSDVNAQSRVQYFHEIFIRPIEPILFLFQALAYFEQLKSSDTGWQLATSTLTNSAVCSTMDDYSKFFCLQVVEVYSKESYPKSNLTQQQAMKNFLSQWIQLQVLIIKFFHRK